MKSKKVQLVDIIVRSIDSLLFINTLSISGKSERLKDISFSESIINRIRSCKKEALELKSNIKFQSRFITFRFILMILLSISFLFSNHLLYGWILYLSVYFIFGYFIRNKREYICEGYKNLIDHYNSIITSDEISEITNKMCEDDKEFLEQFNSFKQEMLERNMKHEN